MRFEAARVDPSNIQIVENTVEEVELPKVTFELNYLPLEVAEAFDEALTCYSNQCYNAFAAMCRRTAQSMFVELGAEGKTRVEAQLDEVKEPAGIDEETYQMLKQIILSGHDGAHPHLPKVNIERAVILLELMKDVLYQLFIRSAKIREATELRRQEIAQKKTEN
ncbi:MAG: DUF4145 domain-containing protein [Anaerolineae bacterium]|nr:DUF4145 domain-containing protein [Anaerolineae bacterium]